MTNLQDLPFPVFFEKTLLELIKLEPRPLEFSPQWIKNFESVCGNFYTLGREHAKAEVKKDEPGFTKPE